MRILLRAVSVLLPLFLLGAMAPALATTPATSFVTMASDSGDYIGGGTTQLWYTGNGSIAVSGSVTGAVDVNVSGGASTGYFTMSFAAAPGQTLTAGQYTGAQRTSFRTSGHPGIDIYGSGRGCNATSGQFNVIDVAPDLSRLWLTYEEHCEGGGPAVFGEVRYNEPGIDPDLLVAPDQIAWPAEYPGVNGRLVPVTLVNTGSSPVTVSSAAITAGSSDFAVAGNTCTTIAVGASCAVTVRFNPSTAGNLSGTLTMTDSTTAGTHTVALSGEGIAGHTSWALESQTGDAVGGGNHYAFNPTNATMSASGNADTVRLVATPISGGTWSAVFRADSSRPLAAGTTFTDAALYSSSSNASPGMLIYGPAGDSCSTLTGTFTVNEASFDVDGNLTKFSVSFEQHCNGAGPALFGSIAWMADNPAAPLPPDTSPPSSVTGLAAYPSISSVILNWTNPTVNDWSDTEVRVAAGDVAPTLTSGDEMSDNRASGSIGDGFAPGNDFTFSVFARDYSGNVGPAATITVRGTSLSLSASPTSVSYGTTTHLRGRLIYSRTMAGDQGQDVVLYGRRAGTATWGYITDETTAADGSYNFYLQPSVNADYEVYFYGGADAFGSTAGPISVNVAPRVTATLNHTRGALGTTFRLSTVVTPNESGQAVLFQRYYSRGWHTVATRVLNSSSAASLSVRTTARGTYLYRVVRPAGLGRAAGVSRTVTEMVT